MKDSIKLYIWGVLVGADQFVNSLLGGHEDHTISGRCGYYGARGSKFYSFCADSINFIFQDPDHCWDSIEWSLMRTLHPNDSVDHINRKITNGDVKL